MSAAPAPTRLERHHLPGNFGSDLGGDFPKNVWILDPAVLNAWGDLHSNRDISRTYYQDMFDLTENTKAIYVQGEMEGEGWSGNVGLRVVRTEGTSNGYQILPNQPAGETLASVSMGVVSSRRPRSTTTPRSRCLA